MKSILIIFAILFCINAEKTIKVATTQSIDPNNLEKPGAVNVYLITEPTINGFQYGLDYVNEHIFPLTIDGEVYDKMELIIEDDKYDENLAFDIFENWLTEDKYDFYLSPYLSISDPPGVEYTLTKLVEDHEKIYLSTSSPYSYFSNYPNQWSFSLETSFEAYMRGTIIPLRIQQAKSAIILNSNTSTIGMCDDKFIESLAFNGIEVIDDIPFSDLNTSQNRNISTYPEPIMNHLREIVNENIKKDPDIWYMCTGNSKLAAVVRKFMKEDHNYTPRAMVNICGSNWNSYEDIDDNLLGYITCIVGTTDDTKYKDDGFGSLNEFKKNYFNKFGNDSIYNSYAELSSLSIRILADILKLSGTKDQYINRDILRRYSTTTFKGIISWNSNHMQNNNGFLLQSNLTNMNIISPYETATVEHIYPEPEWFERQYDKNRYKTAEIVFMTITTLCIVSNFIWAFFILINRNRTTIKAGSPLFLYIILIGSTIAYLYNFVSLPSLSHTVGSCHAKKWLLGVGFVIVFSSMFVKTWRVMVLLTTRTIDLIVITNMDVLLRVIMISTPMIVLLIVNSLITPKSGITRIVLDTHRPYYDYYQCASNTAVNVIQWVSIAYGILLFIIGAFFGFKVRSVPMNIYDESKIIGFSIYNVGFFGVLLLIINNIELSYSNKYVLTCALLIVSNLITINTLMIHKVIYLSNSSSVKGSSSGSNNMRLSTMKSTSDSKA